MQSYNADYPPAERVRVRGIDLPAPAALVSPLRSYFAAVDPRELPAAIADRRRIRHVGSVYDPEADPSWATLETRLPASFDRLAHVSRSSPSRPLDR
ncbi:hypothetical protein BRC62_04775 [Halobacteriales archaeon QH_10_67_13]|nr:MAG: hypothetical protein BRC62_04775 [Halobacteriales archaeon QH_10_67_13]